MTAHAPPQCLDTWELAAEKKAAHANGCFSSTCHHFNGLDRSKQWHNCGTGSVGTNRLGKTEGMCVALRADEKPTRFTVRAGTKRGTFQKWTIGSKR